MRILCNILVVLFVTATAVGQQINPVPDYIFRNSMSVGRNAPTDTSAYFSIGPRFGATRGFMPPMVVDTASVTGTKRNGLLIYSIQRNSFLYWDSTGSRWSRIAANLDTLLLSTRAWRQKGDDSLAAIINTRTDTVNRLSTKAWRQKGIDSVAGLSRVGGSGTINRVPKFTAAGTIGDGSIADSSTSVRMTILSGGNIGVATAAPAYNFDVAGSLRNTTNAFFNTSSGESYFGTTTDAGDYRLQVNGNGYFAGNVAINTSGQTRFIRTTTASGTQGLNIFIGNSGTSLTGTSSNQSSANTIIGVDAGTLITTGNFNTAVGFESLKALTTGGSNVSVGNALVSLTTGSSNTAMGSSALNNITTAVNNTAVGLNALVLMTSGNDNIAVGYDAGRRINSGGNNTSSSNSIYIGKDVRASTTGNSNEIVIGGDGRGNGTNTTTIGNGSTTTTFLLGALDIGTIDSSASPINMLWADVNGVVRKAAVPTASVSGGTTDFIPLWSSSTALTSSVIKQVSSEILIGYTTDQGTHKLQVDGNTFTNGSIKTAAPSGGTAAEWKLGIVVAGSYTAASNYLQVDVGGTLYYIGLVTPN